MNSWYKVVKQNMEWSIAGLACKQFHKDAHLLVINDEQEQLAVARLLSGLSLSLLTVVCCFLSPEMRLCFTCLQCSNYMQARVCRAPSLLVRAPILSEIFGVQRGPA